ncbi:MAG: FAD-dependent oxidoreductase, partial [Candidatus Cloacimonadaceae bacterium]|nr:FAD-dependent oxidoreductase [Candidatus Cloacimonadaceae bacterium]
GLTAGLYAARYKLNTLMLEKSMISGGQLTATEWVENYPGFPEPVLGEKLAKDMEFQAKSFGLQIVNDAVLQVDLKPKIKTIKTDYNTYQAKSVLISTGSSSRKLGIKGEQEYYGRGISYCATCDGPLYPDKVIAVAGGGNSAFEESLFLAKYASQVYIIHRSESYKADPILQDRVLAHEKIKLIPKTQIIEVDFSDPADMHIKIKNHDSQKESILSVDAMFVFIGHDPNTKLFEGQIELKNGYIVTDRTHKTNVEGVWAAGDVQEKALRQVATAVGDGACSAHWIYKYIDQWSEE